VGVRRERILREVVEELPSYPVTVLIAPTGFGKTSLTTLMVEYGVRSLHLLPLRALVSDVMSKLRDKACYQAGVEIKNVAKDPYMLCHHMVATYDSTLLEALVAPVADIGKHRSHWDIASLALYGRTLLMDEVHLLAKADEGEGGVDESSRGLLYLISALTPFMVKYYGSNVIYATASIPIEYVSLLLKVSRDLANVQCRVIVVGGSVILDYYDKLAELNCKLVRIPIDQIEDEDVRGVRDAYRSGVLTAITDRRVEDVVASLIHEGYERILIVANTVKRAVDIYKNLRDRGVADSYKIILIHGRLGNRAREERFEDFLNLYNGGRPLILVSTQVVEAGLDKSFDAVISDIAPIESLIQRFGRILRRMEDAEDVVRRDINPLLVVSLSEDSINAAKQVYGDYQINHTMRGIEDLVKGLKWERIEGSGINVYRIDWRYGEAPTAYSILTSYRVHVDYGYPEAYFSNLEGLLLDLPIFKKDLRDWLKTVSSYGFMEALRPFKLIPLVVCEAEDCRKHDVVDVSISFLRSRFKELLCFDGDCKVQAVTRVCSNERGCWVVVKDVKLGYFHKILRDESGVYFYDFVKNLEEGVRGEIGRRVGERVVERINVIFLGFKVVKGYDREYGIV
jgi:superfamily II DNA or RNA helicase